MRDWRLWLGPIGALILVAGIACLPWWVPGYSSVRQTVSEIGEVGSPTQLPFAVMLALFAVCMFFFALGLRNASLNAGHSSLSAYLTGAMAVIAAGLAINPYPYPLHNVFGLSELVAYLAPLALWLTWRRDPAARGLVIFSAVAAILLWLSILANLSTLAPHSALWTYERPFYGLVQRSLFAIWSVWCLGVGLLLASHPRPEPIRGGVAAP